MTSHLAFLSDHTADDLAIVRGALVVVEALGASVRGVIVS